MVTRIQRASKPIAEEADGMPHFNTTDIPKDTSQRDQILALIPGGASALYLGGISLIPAGTLIMEVIWLIVGLLASILLAADQQHPTQPAVNLPTEWNQVIVTAGAFLIWAYALGGPFETSGLYEQYVAGLLIIFYTFFAPFILRVLDKLKLFR